MYSLDPNKMVMNGLVINQGGKISDMILTSDSNGQVSWKSVASYTSNKNYDHYIGELFGGGVVVAVWKDGNVEKCLVAAIQDVQSVLTTSTVFPSPSNSYSNNYVYPWSNVMGVTAGATYSAYGSQNTSLITGQPGFSTTTGPFLDFSSDEIGGFSGAARWADLYINEDIGYGTFNDWYLPSIFELTALGSNMMIVNKVLNQLSIDKGISLTDSSNSSVASGNIPAPIRLIGGSYWSSTEKDKDYAYYLDASTGKISYEVKDIFTPFGYSSYYKQVRPFRIASDNQVSFKFDAEWIIIGYKFFDGKDLDTRTRMIYPNSTSHPSLITPWNETVAYSNGVNGGRKSANFIGHTSKIPWATSAGDGAATSFTPNVTETVPAEAGRYNIPGIGNNVSGTYSVMIWGGDITGYGGTSESYESILVNVTAFKFHYPGIDTIQIDCRGVWWQVQGTDKVRLGVDMFKGGSPVRIGSQGKQWSVVGSESSISLDSLDVSASGITSAAGVSSGLTPEGSQDSTRISIFEYNINTKIGKIIA